ncbi:MAG: GntR family transcriptional regulator [Dermatophilus congolensis]|nr:GntR family transcriptional regulator [Dermatophilus congolensis]
MALDLDDPRPPYQQVAAQLRAAILNGTFAPGDKLPSQAALSTQYGVARMTIQQALRILKDEGLVVSRQGSGMFVRERAGKPVELRPHLQQAFRAENVTLDFSGFTAETLSNALAEPLDLVRTGNLSPATIAVRLLVPDTTQPLALPVAASGNDSESAHLRDRMRRTTDRCAGAIQAHVEELEDMGLVESATFELRQYASAPMFKAYIINGADVFFGYYPVIRHEVRIGKEKVETLDPMGKDALLFPYTDDGDPNSPGTQFVQQTRAWFDSVWNTLAKPAP